jgi:hypothetical protein
MTQEPEDKIQLELETPEEHKVLTSWIEGVTLFSTTAKKGQKGRTTKKAHKTEAAARKAQEKAVKKKVKEGFFPVGATADDLPLSVKLEGSEIERGPALKIRKVRRQYKNIPQWVRRDCPPQLSMHQPRFRFNYADGPGEYNLWYLPGEQEELFTLYAGRRHFIKQVEPELTGKRDEFLLSIDREQNPFRPDGEALLVGLRERLLELDLASARATELHAFASADDLARARPFRYDHTGARVLHRDGRFVVALDRASGERAPLVELDGEDVVDIAPLAGGLLAVLQPSRLSVFAPADDGRPRRTHRMPCNSAFRLDAVLEGRVLFVMSTSSSTARPTVLLGVHAGALYELHASRHRQRRAFDYRGAQWIVRALTADMDGDRYRLYNLQEVLDHAVATTGPVRGGVQPDPPRRESGTVRGAEAAARARPARRRARHHRQPGRRREARGGAVPTEPGVRGPGPGGDGRQDRGRVRGAAEATARRVLGCLQSSGRQQVHVQVRDSGEVRVQGDHDRPCRGRTGGDPDIIGGNRGARLPERQEVTAVDPTHDRSHVQRLDEGFAEELLEHDDVVLVARASAKAGLQLAEDDRGHQRHVTRGDPLAHAEMTSSQLGVGRGVEHDAGGHQRHSSSSTCRCSSNALSNSSKSCSFQVA